MILIFIHSSWIFLSYFHLPVKFLQIMRHCWAWLPAEWDWAARAVAGLGWQGQPALPCSSQGHSLRWCPHAAALSWRRGELSGRQGLPCACWPECLTAFLNLLNLWAAAQPQSAEAPFTGRYMLWSFFTSVSNTTWGGMVLLHPSCVRLWTNRMFPMELVPTEHQFDWCV